MRKFLKIADKIDDKVYPLLPYIWGWSWIIIITLASITGLILVFRWFFSVI